MLAGMAIEVQLKAILVNSPAVRAVVTGSRPQKTDPNLKLWRRFFSHNLVELALEANVPLTDAEQRVAIALSQYIYLAWPVRRSIG